ncbi:hypothetical protein BGZ65_009709 [Modicella reniformis]|uniref:Uncharacterized protein n=1 Tax=Modicella reniformis TaxID=1440133 RepID=A0A9P6M1W7_9FUNG|nr:hypothetical protein BGZ65_009709 [Modicella reniformis]
MKEYNEMQAERFGNISNTLAQKLKGSAAWLDVPLMTEPEPPKITCEPKVFFLQEAIYKDWIERDGMNHWFDWRINKRNELPTTDSGRSPLLWFEVYYCHREGKPEKPKLDDPDARRRQVYKDTLKIGSNATLYVHKFKPGIIHPALVDRKDPNALVRITYYPEHNHTLGYVSEFYYQRISNTLRARIRYFVSLGLPNRQIRERLTRPIWELHDFVTADDVANVVYDYWKHKAKLHRKRKNKDQNSGKDKNTNKDSDKNSEKDSGIGKFELFTVIVQDRRTMRAVPAAFLLTTNKMATPIHLWLSAFNALSGPFRYITTDDSATERLAIKNAFGGSSKELRKNARQDLLAIMYESDLFETSSLIEAFRQNWRKRSPELCDYIETNYFKSEEHMRTWMKAYRQDEYYAKMDTNNFVESWHNHLKSHILKRQFVTRADRTVYLLSDVVVNYFKQEEFQAYVRVGRKTRGEIQDILRQREVRAFSNDTIQTHLATWMPV